MSEKRNYNKFLDEIIKEVEEELEESSATGNVAGYETPNVFGDGSEKNKKRKKQVATQAGYTVVDNDVKNINETKIDKTVSYLKNQIKKGYLTRSQITPDEIYGAISKLHIKLSPKDVEEVEFELDESNDVNESYFKPTRANLGKPPIDSKHKELNKGDKIKYAGKSGIVLFRGMSNGVLYYNIKVGDKTIKHIESRWIKSESVDESKDRDYKAEYQARKKDYYKKYQSSTKSKKYRAELNKYNRDKGTYGNGDGLDASHKGGKIVGFETENKNRSRKEKSRLKKESFEDNHDIYTKEFSKRGFKWKDDRGFDMWYKDYPLGRFVVSYEGKSSTNRYTYHIFFNPYPKYKTHFFGLIKSKDRKLGNQIDYKQDIIDFGVGLFKVDDSTFMKKLFKEVDDAEKQVKQIKKVDYLSYKDSERFSHPAVGESITESKLKGKLSGDVKDSIAKELSYYVSRIIKTPNNNYTYLQLKDKNKGKQVVVMLKDLYGIKGKVEPYEKGKVSETPAVVFSNNQIVEAKNPKRKNRWLELKNDDSMHGHKKLAVGLKELKYQLREVEKFLGWYNKLKNINELDSDNYWKRTNSNIYKIKERLVNIVKKIQEIEK